MRHTLRLLPSALLALGCTAGPVAEADEWMQVRQDDLVVGVEVTGTLRAKASDILSPPAAPNIWQFKISRMATEGARVKRGDPVLAFDASELERKLAERVAERDAAAKMIAKKGSDLVLWRRDLEARLNESEAAARKAALKADRPPGTTAAIELEVARLDAELARREVEALRSRLRSSARTTRVEEAAVRDRLTRAQGRVDELQRSVARFTLKAPRDGTVVYPSGFRDEKKKVGDTSWRGETVMEIADLGEMHALGEIDEVDVSRAALGHRVTLRLDAHPDVELAGTVRKLADTIQRQSPLNPLKVLRVTIALDKSDPTRMRPGMRFRGVIETERVPKATVVPAEAVFPRPGGPVAFRRRVPVGFEVTTLKLGRRNSRYVEVLGGLAVGDAVSPRDLERGRPRSAAGS